MFAFPSAFATFLAAPDLAERPDDDGDEEEDDDDDDEESSEDDEDEDDDDLCEEGGLAVGMFATRLLLLIL